MINFKLRYQYNLEDGLAKAICVEPSKRSLFDRLRVRSCSDHLDTSPNTPHDGHPILSYWNVVNFVAFQIDWSATVDRIVLGREAKTYEEVHAKCLEVLSSVMHVGLGRSPTKQELRFMDQALETHLESLVHLA